MIKKICLRQQKMNVMNFLIFRKNKHSMAFKQMVMNSETINGSVDTDKTVITKILNKN